MEIQYPPFIPSPPRTPLTSAPKLFTEMWFKEPPTLTQGAGQPAAVFVAILRSLLVNRVILENNHTQNKVSGNRHDALFDTFYCGSGEGEDDQGSHKDNRDVSGSVANIKKTEKRRRYGMFKGAD